jgi:ABC-2 type transport system permease protein
MRAALLNGQLAWDHLAYAFGLDLIWLGLAAWLFMAQFQAARVRGALMNIGE